MYTPLIVGPPYEYGAGGGPTSTSYGPAVTEPEGQGRPSPVPDPGPYDTRVLKESLRTPLIGAAVRTTQRGDPSRYPPAPPRSSRRTP
jgi:hypothetical protein